MLAWTARPSLFDGGSVSAGCYAADLGQYVAVGSAPAGTHPSIATSDDGLTWAGQTSPFDDNACFGIARCEAVGLYVAAGANADGSIAIATSPDGLLWIGRGNPFGLDTAGAVAVKESGPLVMVADFSSFTDQPIATSGDGLAYTLIPAIADEITVKGIGYSPSEDRWIAGGLLTPGSSAYVMYSDDDGATWAEITQPLDLGVIGVYRDEANGKWYLLGGATDGATVAVSTDNGATWNVLASPLDNPGGGAAAATTAFGLLVASGVGVDSPGTTIIESEDGGSSWTADTSPFDNSIASALFASPSLLVAVGASSDNSVTIATAAPPPPETSHNGILVAFDDHALTNDPTYTRLDDPNGYRLASTFTIERGRDDVSQQMATATATVTFIDRDGILDPTNPDGPFYGKLLPRLQAKIQRWNPVTDEWDTRFKGHTKAWRYSIDPSGNLSTCRLEIVGPFEFLTTEVMTPGDQGDTPPPESVGDIYFKGGPTDMVHVNTRIHEVLDDLGWPRGPNWRRIYSGNVYVQDKVYERFTQGLPVLQDAADAEFPWIANFFEGMVERRGFGSGIVIFHGRYARFRPEVAQYDIRFWKVGDGTVAAEDPGTVPFVDELPFHISDEELYNVADPLPEGISDTDTLGQLTKDNASISKYGRRPVPSLDNLQTYRGNSHGVPPTNALEETKLFGEFIVENYKDPVVQVDSITIKSRSVDHPNAAAIWEFLNNVELNDVITLNTTHKGGGGFDEDFFVDKITEVDEPLHTAEMPDLHEVTMQLDLTPRSRYENNPFSPCADNDDMGCATPLDGGADESGELTATNYGFSNDGPESDPGGGDSWDPLREQFFTADDPADPGNPLPSNHNFRTAWFSFSTAASLDLHVEVDVPDAGAAIIVTTDPAPPPSNRDSVLASGDLAVAGTIDLGTVSLSDQTVWIGVGVYGAEGFEFTVRWTATP